VYWGNPQPSGVGYAYDEAVEIVGRWEERQEIFIDANGREQLSNAVVYLAQDVDVNGYLYLGALPVWTGLLAHYAATMDINKGSIFSGPLSKTYDRGANELILNELTGSDAFNYDFNFTGLPNDTSKYIVCLDGWYEGNPAHNIKLQIYNVETPAWENVTSSERDFPDEDEKQIYQFELPTPIGDYVSSQYGLKLKILHLPNGSAGHYFHINWLYLDTVMMLDPTDVASYPIRAFKKTPNLKATEFERKAWL